MAICFQLFRKGEPEPTSLSKIDEELCKLLNLPVDPVKYVASWYDTIGFRLALGKSFQEIREDFGVIRDGEHVGWTSQDDIMLDQWFQILDYLEENYSPNSWTEVGKR